MSIRNLLIGTLFLTSTNAFAQSAVDSKPVTMQDIQTLTDKFNEKLNEKHTEKPIAAGFSLAYRAIWKNFQDAYQSPSISPIDSTLKLQNLDLNAFVLSTSVIITPFVNNDKLKAAIEDNHGWKKFGLNLIKNIGVSANVNLLELTQAQNNFTFNKGLEGGIGVSLKIAPKIFICYSNEILYSKQLRDDVKQHVNEKLKFKEEVVTSISQIDNDNFFITKSVIARSFRIILTF